MTYITGGKDLLTLLFNKLHHSGDVFLGVLRFSILDSAIVSFWYCLFRGTDACR